MTWLDFQIEPGTVADTYDLTPLTNRARIYAVLQLAADGYQLYGTAYVVPADRLAGVLRIMSRDRITFPFRFRKDHLNDPA